MRLFLTSFVDELEKTAAYAPPWGVESLRKKHPHLLDDPVHRWRAEQGIDLIHREPTREELERIWKNWQSMSPDQKRRSDEQSQKLFGVTNEEHYRLIKTAALRDQIWSLRPGDGGSSSSEMIFPVGALHDHAVRQGIPVGNIPIKDLLHSLKDGLAGTPKEQEADIVSARMYPILVVRGLREDGRLHVVDGLHRLTKAMRRGDKTIRGRVIDYGDIEPLVEDRGSRQKTAAFYHGSPRKYDVLTPQNKHGDPDVDKVVFATPSHAFALTYTGKKWSDRDLALGYYGSGPDRPMVLREMRPGAFKDIYEKKKGYLYHLPEEPFHPPAKRKFLTEQVSSKSVTPIKVEQIMDALAALRAEKNVNLIDYDPNAEANRVAVRRSIKRMQGMPDKGVGYLKWRLKTAPPEIVEIYKEELAAAGMGKTAARIKPINYRPVESSNLASVGYDAKRKVLDVKFLGSGTYRYSNVPPKVYRNLLRSKSKGKAFHRLVRKADFDYEKLSSELLLERVREGGIMPSHVHALAKKKGVGFEDLEALMVKLTGKRELEAMNDQELGRVSGQLERL